jgi:hypothetical protein
MAGQRSCDHLHDGMGFFTGHNAITIEFEKALQVVDPSVSVPYWDYTIDMHNVLLNNKVGAWLSCDRREREDLIPIGLYHFL